MDIRLSEEAFWYNKKCVMMEIWAVSKKLIAIKAVSVNHQRLQKHKFVGFLWLEHQKSTFEVVVMALMCNLFCTKQRAVINHNISFIILTPKGP